MAESQLTILALDDWSDGAERHFDADTFPLGITARKARPDAGSTGGSRHAGGSGGGLTRVAAAGESFAIPQTRLTVMGSEWSLVPPEIGVIAARLQLAQVTLVEALGRMPLMGVKTGANEAFFLDVVTERDDVLITTDGVRVPRAHVRRCVRGRDVRAWIANDSLWMLWPPRDGWKKTPRWLQRHATARGVDPESLRLQYVRPEHDGIKVVWKDLSRGLRAAVAGVAIIPNQTLYLLDAATPEEADVVAALLNSTIVNALALCITERAKDRHYRYFGRTIARIPLPRLRPADTALPRLAPCGSPA